MSGIARLFSINSRSVAFFYSKNLPAGISSEEQLGSLCDFNSPAFQQELQQKLQQQFQRWLSGIWHEKARTRSQLLADETQ